MLWGLFKKIVVADNIGVAVFAIYNHPENYGTLTIIYGAFLFLFQLYADFSGYSDIAIGTAKLFGFDLSINFKLPYLANSVTGFWRRWHITLSKWFQDYVYVPFVRGNFLHFLPKSSKKIVGLLLTMGLIGLWHGANWTYLAFGLLHGVLIIIEGTTITNEFSPALEQEHRGINRNITTNGTKELFHKINEGESIKLLEDGTYIINGESYFVEFSSENSLKPFIRKSNGKDELLVKIPSGKQTINYTIIW